MREDVRNGKAKPYITLLYILLWVLVLSFSFSTLSEYGLNVAFSGVTVAGIGFWLYGRKYRFLLVFVWLLYHFSLCNMYDGPDDIGQYKLFPNIVALLLAWLVGEIRHNHDSLGKTYQYLDHVVEERNRDLENLIEMLIDRRERIRSEQGEKLHNNIGQNLTGIKLYCDSLSERKDAVLHSTILNSTRSISSTVSHVHGLVRKAAQALFPVQIERDGLLPAIRNLSVSLEASHHANITINSNVDHLDVSNALALQLYRIYQETIQYILDHDEAKSFQVALTSHTNEYRLEVSCDRPLNESGLDRKTDMQIIKYRVRKIGGKMRIKNPHAGLSTVLYSVPNTGYAQNAE